MAACEKCSGPVQRAGGTKGRPPKFCDTCNPRGPGWKHRTKRTDARYVAGLNVNRTKARAERKGLPFDLDINWMHERLQQGCALTRLPFDLTLNLQRGKGSGHPLAPSVDRIEPARGYVKDNCRVVFWGLNALKGAGTDEHAMFLARALVEAADPHP